MTPAELNEIKKRLQINRIILKDQVYVKDVTDLLAHISELSEEIGRLEAIQKDVLSEAVSTIYFNDNSDYLRVLWTIARKISPQAAKLLERDESAAIEKYTDLIIKEEPD